MDNDERMELARILGSMQFLRDSLAETARIYPRNGYPITSVQVRIAAETTMLLEKLLGWKDKIEVS